MLEDARVGELGGGGESGWVAGGGGGLTGGLAGGRLPWAGGGTGNVSSSTGGRGELKGTVERKNGGGDREGGDEGFGDVIEEGGVQIGKARSPLAGGGGGTTFHTETGGGCEGSVCGSKTGGERGGRGDSGGG